MCLHPTEEGLKKYDGKKGTFKFYKIFKLSDNDILKSPFHNHRITKPGRICLPKKASLEISYITGGIYEGCFHGYDCKKHAQREHYGIQLCFGCCVIIPIYVKGEDIIAADHTNGTVCFFSYEIKKVDFDSVLKGDI